MEDIPPYQRCRHCGQTSGQWLWRLIETYPEHIYEKLCLACIKHQEATFNADTALRQAQAVVMFHQAILDGRVVRATGGAR